MKYNFEEVLKIKNKISGVYMIHNLITDKYYIGESINIVQRIKNHYNNLWDNEHHNKDILGDMKKYGLYNFEIEIIHIIKERNLTNNEVKNIILYLESAYYLKYKKIHKMYNITNPIKAIENKTISIDNYDIDFEKIIEMLKEDTYKIGYEKYDFNFKVENKYKETISSDEILNCQEYINIELIENRLRILNYKDKLTTFIIKNYSEFILSDIKKQIILLLYHNNKINFIKSGSTDDNNYIPKTPNFLKLAIINDDTYIYQLENDKKWKHTGYINLNKSFQLSPQAQKDIYNFLNIKEINNGV